MTQISCDRKLRILEALIFASAQPVDEQTLGERSGLAKEVGELLEELKGIYSSRGIHLTRTGGRWWFHTAPDLAEYLRSSKETPRTLSRPARDTLAIIAYHQPVTRSEIDAIRGVESTKNTFDILMEAGWIRPGKRRETPGRPITWITTDGFLDHFGLDSLRDLPNIEEIRAAGLLDAKPALETVPDNSAIEQPSLDDAEEV